MILWAGPRSRVAHMLNPRGDGLLCGVYLSRDWRPVARRVDQSLCLRCKKKFQEIFENDLQSSGGRVY